MAVEKDLVDAIAAVGDSVTALENKPDSTPGSGVVTQGVLDASVDALNSFKARIDAETEKK